MKLKILLLTLASFIIFSSCQKGFDKLNIDPTGSKDGYPNQFMSSALVKTVGYNMQRNRTFNNELMQVTVNMSDGEGRVFRYDIRRNWSDYTWNSHYLNMSNYKDMYSKSTRGENTNKSYQGISLVLQSWTYSILTDTYGDIPYSGSILGRDSLNFEPQFDPQFEIYKDIFDKLDTANAYLATNQSIDPTHDPVYSGNVNNWRRFSNSLYLRLLLRVVHKEEIKEFATQKIQEILETKKAEYPIISKNEESAILRWTGNGAYISPFMLTRVQDFRAVAIAEFFIDFLRDSNDPRLNIPEYGTGNVNRLGIAPISGSYTGVPSGYEPGNEDVTKMSYFYSADQQGGVNSLQKEPLTGMMLNFSEVEFIKAEAILKGIIKGNVRETFYSGVESCIRLWLPNWKGNAQSHLVASDIDWNDNENIEQKMERLHRQKYYALFMVDNQQWFEHRRTGHPILPKGKGLSNNGEMPARMTYPVYVQSTNSKNYRAAIERQGPDEMNTKVWWQKP